MKKVTALSLVFSLSTLLVIFLFTLTSWSSINPPFIKDIPVSAPESVPSSEVLDITHLPLNVPEATIVPLGELQDAALQSKLEEILHSNSSWVALSKNKALSIGIVDMEDPMHSRFAAINPNNMVYAASLPKIAILLASEDAIASGKLKETPEVKADMRLMIAKSNNAAACRMFNRVGIDQISSVLQDPCYNLYDKEHGGGLWVGKPYGSCSTRVGDPIKGLSHAASVMQVCKYYYMLAFGQLVNEERSKDMLQMLVDPELHHKFISVLDKVAPTAKVYRKSGTWENWHADSVLVWDKNRRYIVVALAQDQNGETILRDLMLKIDNVLALKG
ncbi:MAG: serine hydrolase [Saprospiraceae bacterium]|nr:serine hydrolase [Saprospiraceae bacterium]